MDSFYRDNILDHYRNPRNYGPLPEATSSHEELNQFCGDKISMHILLKKPTTHHKQLTTIRDITFNGEGCAISMASASMLTERVKGMSPDEVMKLNSDDVLEMLGIELTVTRLKCALLPLETLQKAVQKLR